MNYITAQKLSFSGLNRTLYLQLLTELHELYYIDKRQLIENAGFSLGMVLRSALGLEARDAFFSTVISDTLAGQIAAAGARTLVNNGASANVFVLGKTTDCSNETTTQLLALKASGANIIENITSANDLVTTPSFASALEISHALVNGIADIRTDPQSTNHYIDFLNDHQVPIHTIFKPLGIDSDTGQNRGTPLCSSTCLVPGVNLIGLPAAHTYTGRTYLCDISIPKALYEKYALPLHGVFSAQPVIQIFPEVINDE